MAKTLAAERGINLADITGTGPEGRITASDVEAYKAPAGGKKEGAKSEKKKDEGPKIGTCTFLLSQCLFAHPQELRSRVPECEHERQHAPCMS
jgi:pyruvate/2-oxoglutarate dehydrogenase complex dihydrolipoamide acyltransferase (E2) component